MTKTERIRHVLQGNVPDRASISLWGHHPRHEVTTDGLVQITLEFQANYDWDFVKINPRAEYHAEAWGNRYALYLDDRRRPELLSHVVKEPRDFERIEELDPREGILGEHLQAVKRIRGRLGPNTPLIMTLFTPLSVAAELAGKRRDNPAEILDAPVPLRHALEAITRTFSEYARLLIEAGADGLFYATTRLGTRTYLTDDQFREFSVPYDLRVLEAASAGWFNVLHVCGSSCMLDLTREYPVAAYSWDMCDPSNPGPEVVVQGWQRTAIGGIPQRDLSHRSKLEQIKSTMRKHWEAVQGRRFILAGGCVVPTDADPVVMRELRSEADRLVPAPR